MRDNHRLLPQDRPYTLVSRRQALAIGVGAAYISLSDCGNAQPKTLPLKKIASAKGITFGSEIHGQIPGVGRNSYDDAGYRSLLIQECAAVEPGIEMKWPVIEQKPGILDFSRADRFMTFATANDLKVRGINVIWMNAAKQPEWLSILGDRSDRMALAEQIVRRRAEQVCSRYGDHVLSWDVVNEAIDDVTGLPRPSILAESMGGIEPIMDIAFHAAREAAPNAELVYNDFMTWSDGSQRHRKGVLKLLEGFRKRGTPVDALGIQAHIIGLPSADPSADRLARSGDWSIFLNSVTAMGYRLVITEFDVDDVILPSNYSLRDQAVADTAERYLDITLSYPELHTLMVWGLVDRYSWLQYERPRWDRLARRPCPYSDSLNMKPLRSAIARCLAGAPTR